MGKISERRIRWGSSIYLRLVRLLLAAALCAVVSYFLIDAAAGEIVTQYWRHSGYVQRENRKKMDLFQEYISGNGIAGTDTDRITEWVKENYPVSLQIYRDNIVIYDSSYPYYENLWKESIKAEYYDWGSYYPVQFQDGEAVAALYGFHMFQLYNVAAAAELIVSFLIFLGIVLLGIRSTMKYIKRLSSEIEILEGGDLDYKITVKGTDELAALAQGIDDMRKSFLEQTRQEARLVRMNRQMVTGMSHDLRTPLTSIMLYVEIMKKAGGKDEEKLKECMERIERQVCKMKQLADYLFEYSLISSKEELKMEPPEQFDTVFYDLMSETCALLEQRGFETRMHGRKGSGRVSVHMDYVMRIFDNITSNIVKYADRNAPVEISCIQEKGAQGFTFHNRKKEMRGTEESNKIGIQNIQTMMKKMNGWCRVEETEEEFSITVLFPVSGPL